MKKILIVEDDQVAANIYRNNLALEGYRVEVALNGEAAMNLLPAFTPDVVLLDLMLPGMPGTEVLQRIKSMKEFKDIPVIVFSNTYLSSMIEAAWKAGATKCLSKANCTPRQLLDVLRGLDGKPALQAAIAMPPEVPEPVTQSTNSSQAAAVIAPVTFESVAHQELRRKFCTMLPGLLSAMRPILQFAVKADDGPIRADLMAQMHQQMRVLTGGAGIAGFSRVAQMCAALEALLKELHEKPNNINKSTLRTVATAMDFIRTLLAPGEIEEKSIPSFGNILVVDDEPMSRRAVSFALERASLNSISVANPQTALELLAGNRFDLIFLDIDMPEMSGLELCSKLREMSAHKKTPVIFVTALNDFDNRASSTMSGGTDLIGKPFLFMELAVKALCYVLRARLEAPKPNPNSRTALLAVLED